MKFKLKNLIQSQDFFGNQITLKFNGSDRAQSIVGGIFSILTKIFLILLAMYKLYELLLSSNPKVAIFNELIDTSAIDVKSMNLNLILMFNSKSKRVKFA